MVVGQKVGCEVDCVAGCFSFVEVDFVAGGDEGDFKIGPLLG
jgi:hypothetical protein